MFFTKKKSESEIKQEQIEQIKLIEAEKARHLKQEITFNLFVNRLIGPQKHNTYCIQYFLKLISRYE